MKALIDLMVTQSWSHHLGVSKCSVWTNWSLRREDIRQTGVAGCRLWGWRGWRSRKLRRAWLPIELGQRLGLDVEVVDQPGHRLLLALCAVQEEPGDRLAGDERILIGHLWTKEVWSWGAVLFLFPLYFKTSLLVTLIEVTTSQWSSQSHRSVGSLLSTVTTCSSPQHRLPNRLNVNTVDERKKKYKCGKKMDKMSFRICFVIF